MESYHENWKKIDNMFDQQFTQTQKQINKMFKFAIPLAIGGGLLGLGLIGALIYLVVRLAAHV
jgi:hypothetical protein